MLYLLTPNSFYKMKISFSRLYHLTFLLLIFFFIYSCETDEEYAEKDPEIIVEPEISPEKLLKIFQNKSLTEPLVNISEEFPSLEAYSLLSTADTLGGNFRLGGSADGAGFLKDGDGFLYVVNCENDYSIARVRLDEFLSPIGGDYLLHRGVADYAKQCSATMWEAAIHGGSKDIFLSASEAFHFQVKAMDPRIAIPDPIDSYGLEALGEFSWENAVPLPKNTYPGKTVILGGDDDGTDSAGQIIVYLSENGDDDLENGKIYVLKTNQISNGLGGVNKVNNEEIYTEASFDFGVTYEVEFVEIENGRNLTKDEMEATCNDISATQFMRVEDLDYQKGNEENARNIFFAVTGGGPGTGTYNDWGTVYKLELDENSPLKGNLTQVISGNTNSNNKDGNFGELQSPDNICVTENYVYIQEDPISFSRGHAASIYQSDLNGTNIKKVLEMAPLNDGRFKGEFGSLIDISEKIGIDDTFMLALMPKREVKSQIILLKGLPR